MNLLGKKNSAYSNCKVSIFTGDKVETYPLEEIQRDLLEFKEGLLPLDEAKVFHDISNGGLHYVFHLDLPAKVEAGKLKNLYRSAVIHNIFSYDKKKPLDVFKLLPWIVTIVALLVK
jgi:hypothetical protein